MAGTRCFQPSDGLPCSLQRALLPCRPRLRLRVGQTRKNVGKNRQSAHSVSGHQLIQSPLGVSVQIWEAEEVVPRDRRPQHAAERPRQSSLPTNSARVRRSHRSHRSIVVKSWRALICVPAPGACSRGNARGPSVATAALRGIELRRGIALPLASTSCSKRRLLSRSESLRYRDEESARAGYPARAHDGFPGTCRRARDPRSALRTRLAKPRTPSGFEEASGFAAAALAGVERAPQQ